MDENIARFGNNDGLIGIVTEPSGKDNHFNNNVAVLILNAGLIHRAGPNLLFVSLSRIIAQAGFICLRFDFSGIGDSVTRNTNNKLLSVKEKRSSEIRQAMDYLEYHKKCRNFIIIGLCNGADFAFNMCLEEKKVIAACLINGNFIGYEYLKTINAFIEQKIRNRFYTKKKFNLSLWTGNLRSLSILSKFKRFFKTRKQLNRPLHLKDFQEWDIVIKKNMPVLLIYSEGSKTFDVYNLIHKKKLNKAQTDNIETHIIKNTDHIFTPLWSQNELVNKIMVWLKGLSVKNTALYGIALLSVFKGIN